MLLTGSLWHKGAYNRTFTCMEATYPLCHKEPARSKQRPNQTSTSRWTSLVRREGLSSVTVVCYCRLWCAIQKYNGSLCSSCPPELLSQTTNQLACGLWEELQALQALQHSGVSLGLATATTQAGSQSDFTSRDPEWCTLVGPDPSDWLNQGPCHENTERI